MLPNLPAQIRRLPIRRLIPRQIPHRALFIELINAEDIYAWPAKTIHDTVHCPLDLRDLFRVGCGGVPVLDVEACEVVVVR